MWRNHLLLAVRRLGRDRLGAAINLSGLAFGMAACVLILAYIRHERGYDGWVPGSDRLFQVQARAAGADRPDARGQLVPEAVGKLLPRSFPEVEAASMVNLGMTVRAHAAIRIASALVDEDFFRVFPLPFLAGDRRRALPDRYSAVLTVTEARRQFGTTNVVGRVLPLGAGTGIRAYRVTGVVSDLPQDTNMRFGVVFRTDEVNDPAGPHAWDPGVRQLWVRLRSPANATAINAALPAWERRTVPPAVPGGSPRRGNDTLALALVPATAVHLGAAQAGAVVPSGDPVALAGLAVVAGATLALAVSNFVLLATAQASRRAREVALRKVLGATRGHLVTQFMAEALAAAGTATLLALALVELAAKPLGVWLGVELGVAYLGRGGLLLPATGLLLLTGLAAGFYPALVLSGFRPGRILHGGQPGGEAGGGARLRVVLVTVQFAAVIALIACTGVVMAQVRYVAGLDPGYRPTGLIQVETAWRLGGDPAEYASAKRELLAVPGVTAVGRSSLVVDEFGRKGVRARLPGAAADIIIGFYSADGAMPEAMGTPLLAGRLLDEARGGDRVPYRLPLEPDWARDLDAIRRNGLNVVVNRSAATLFGPGPPAAALGRTVQVALAGAALVPATVVGVVEDVRVRGPREAPEPIIWVDDPYVSGQVLVRFADVAPAQVMAGVQRVWRRHEPEIPFDGRFTVDVASESLRGDRTRGALFALFTGLATGIACLGLFGLAVFTAERRTREIGLRKVLGAGTGDIVRLLVWQAGRPVLVANLVAWPVAWWAMRRWLDGFDQRVALTPWPFLGAGALALGIAVATVAGHAVRVARASPARALREE